jgi:hypothetical protein
MVRQGTRNSTLDNVLVRIWLQRSHIERARLRFARRAASQPPI